MLVAVRDKEGNKIGMKPVHDVIYDIKSESPTAIIMRFVLWLCVNVLKTAWTLVCASVIASAGMVWMHYDYGKKVLKSVIDIWKS